MNWHLAAAAALVAAGCGSESAPITHSRINRLGSWAPPPSATLLKAGNSGLENQTFVMVESAAAWQAMWADAWRGQPATPALPSVDFVLASVLVVGTGKRTGGGYSVTIDSVVVSTNESELFATATQPASGCPPVAGFSAPVHMVMMPGHPPIARWNVRNAVAACTAAGR